MGIGIESEASWLLEGETRGGGIELDGMLVVEGRGRREVRARKLLAAATGQGSTTKDFLETQQCFELNGSKQSEQSQLRALKSWAEGEKSREGEIFFQNHFDASRTSMGREEG